MAFCAQCGTQVPDGDNFCPGCGAAQAAQEQAAPQTEQTAQQASPNPGAQTQNAQTDASQAADKINETISKIMDTADTSAQFDPADIEKNKLISVLSYLGLLFLVPLFAAKESKFARFHVNQGVVLFAASFIYGIVSAILGVIFGLIPVIGTIVGILLGVIALVPTILMILGIYNAATGHAKELPLIGQIRIIK